MSRMTKRKLNEDQPVADPLAMSYFNFDQSVGMPEKFFEHMRRVAKMNDDENAFKEGYRSILPALNRDITFFEAGRYGMVPTEWSQLYAQFVKDENDVKFKQFIELRTELKEKIQVSEQTVSNWVHSYGQASKPSGSTKSTGRRKK